MTLNFCLLLNIIIVSIYAQTTPSPVSQQEESSDSSSTTPKGEQWTIMIIVGIVVIFAVIIAADCVHKKFQSQYANLMVNIHGDQTSTKSPQKSWAQQPHLKSAPTPKKPKETKPKTTEKIQKNTEQDTTKKDTNSEAKKDENEAKKPKKDVVFEEENATDTTETDDADTNDTKQNEVVANEEAVVNKEDNIGIPSVAITKQVTDVIIAQQDESEVVETKENDGSVIMKDDEDEIEDEQRMDDSLLLREEDPFPAVDVLKMSDVEIVIKKDEEDDTEDDIEEVINEENGDRSPTPLDDPEIVIKPSGDGDAEYIDSSGDDEAQNIATNVRGVDTPVKDTLEAAWNLGGSEDSSGSDEGGDVMGDLASVRVEINRRALQNLAPIHDIETPQSTAL